jgi:hypothetical protein
MQCRCTWIERIFWTPRYIDSDVSEVTVAPFWFSSPVSSEKQTQTDAPSLANLRPQEPAKVVIVYGVPVNQESEIERV